MPIIFCIFAEKFFHSKIKNYRVLHIYALWVHSTSMDCPKCKIGDYVKDGILRGLQRYTCTVYEVQVVEFCPMFLNFTNEKAK